jgi:hyperosmotically inducible protein
MRRRIIPAAFAVFLLAGNYGMMAYGADNSSKAAAKADGGIQREVRHELLMLSHYGVFDNIAYRVDGTQVTLLGQVTQPYLKDEARDAIKGIEGVTQVNNQIEVLPLSPMDDNIRRAVYRSIYGDASLSRYAFQAVPSIHIIVKNGDVTLEGAVATEFDRNLANTRANTVGGVFSVKNNLMIDTKIG